VDVRKGRLTPNVLPALALALLLSACAARTVPPAPVPAAPAHPEFIYPAFPDGTPPASASLIENGWRYLQGNNLRFAERAFQEALKRQPKFAAADAGLGYVELAAKNGKGALTHFDRALQEASSYVPALVGRGLALLTLGRDGDALASFEAALEIDPSLSDLESRIEVLRFRAVQDNLARARAATDAGRFDEARAAYGQAIAASPESAFLYRDLAIVERKSGDRAAAVQNLRKAIELDPNDARAHAELGAVLEEQGEYDAALAAYEKASALDSNEVPAETLARVRERVAFAKLPPEYQGIPTASTVTRAQLAALIGVRLQPLLASVQPRQVVVTDIRTNWARDWILPVVQAGVMETQPNYTFQPGGVVRRGDLANIVARTLGLIAQRNPARARVWQSANVTITDVAPGHLSYPAVSQAVASGVMTLEGGAFQLLRPVSGAEAVEVVSRLEALARP
jgi:tetratricopeptide (TPR) repeat protein